MLSCPLLLLLAGTAATGPSLPLSRTAAPPPAAACPNGEVFVSAHNGSDVHSGCSFGESVATVERAQQVARATRASASSPAVTVWLDSGVYELAGTLQLVGEADSHTTWAAATSSATPPVISAGRVVRGFAQCTATDCPVNVSGVFVVNLTEAVGLSGDALGNLTARGWPGVHAPAPLELFTHPAVGGAASTTGGKGSIRAASTCNPPFLLCCARLALSFSLSPPLRPSRLVNFVYPRRCYTS